MTAIELLVEALVAQGWTAGDILVPEQCAEMWCPSTETWIHITAQFNG